MNNLNYIFFEEFKKLEKLCGEMYGSHNGVTNYIDDMKDVPYSNYRDIPNWEDDLSQLKKKLTNGLKCTKIFHHFLNMQQIL